MSGKEVARVPQRQIAHTAANGRPNDGTLVMEDARIVFRNFEGKEGQYNREGDRNFCILLENEQLVSDMMADGWNIKRLRPRDDAEVGTAYIQVAVGFGKGRPPIMNMITSKGKITLGEDECILIDWADILICDVIIRPYHWNVNGKTGVKAYLKSIFITINEDFLELKYADVPAVDMSGVDHDNNAKAVEATADALALANSAGQDAGAMSDDGQDIVDAEIMEDGDF